MTDASNDLKETGTPDAADAGASFTERYTEILGNLNTTLAHVDWGQMSRIGKGVGVLVIVIVAQVLIKGILDTINLLPIVPGVLELLGLAVGVQWCWRNLATSDKRTAVVNKAQTLRKDYLG